MNKKLMIVGFGATLAVLFCFGSGQTTSPETSSSEGRYRMFSPNPTTGGVSDLYVIDTQTGRVWRRIFFTDVKGLYFKSQPYLSADDHTISAAPPASSALESLTMQNNYDREINQADQRKSDK
jgi:hypothetical protein